MKAILFAYGEGGHAAQMNRLAPKVLECLSSEMVAVSISDVKNASGWTSAHFVTGEVRGKYKHSQLFTNAGPIKIIRTIKKISNQYDVKAVVTTGPGIGIFASMYFKMKGAKIIHIETWSRFETASLTGKVMYRLADDFYIQNKSLVKFYPNSIYSGVL